MVEEVDKIATSETAMTDHELAGIPLSHLEARDKLWSCHVPLLFDERRDECNNVTLTGLVVAFEDPTTNVVQPVVQETCDKFFHGINTEASAAAQMSTTTRKKKTKLGIPDVNNAAIKAPIAAAPKLIVKMFMIRPRVVHLRCCTSQ